MKIIYLAHHALGDAVMKVPAIHYLTSKFGSKNVFLTVKDSLIKDFLADHTSLYENNLIIYNQKFSKRQKINFILKLRKLSFDFFILPPTIDNRNGKLLFKLSGAKKLISHYEFGSVLNKKKAYVNKFQHKVLQNIEFVRFFEKWNDQQIINFAKANYFLNNINPENITNFNLNHKYIILHPGSGNDLHKRYPINKWSDLVKSIIKKYPDYKIYITGTGNETNLAKKIIAINKNNVNIINIVDRYNLKQLMTIIQKSNLFISADCGPAHLASILKKEMVTIFGPSDFNLTGPFTNCSPIYPSFHYKKNPFIKEVRFHKDGTVEPDFFNLINNSEILRVIDKILDFHKDV